MLRGQLTLTEGLWSWEVFWRELSLPKMWKSQPLVPVNVTLCENRVFADDRVRKVTVGEPWSSMKGPLMTGDAWTRTRRQGRGRGGVTGPGLGFPAPRTVSPAVSAVKLALRGAWSQHPGRTDAELCPSGAVLQHFRFSSPPMAEPRFPGPFKPRRP